METRKCSRCEERKPVSEFYKKGFNKQGIQQYTGQCRQPKEFTDADEERIFSARQGAVSMSISAELANEACPQLDPKNWPIGVAESIYKQFGREWSYL